MKIVKQNQPKIVIFTDVENRCILHGHVFVMCNKCILVYGSSVCTGRQTSSLSEWLSSTQSGYRPHKVVIVHTEWLSSTHAD